MSARYAAEVTVWNTDTDAEETHYFSTDAFVTGATDTPAHTAFLPRLQQPALLQRACFEQGATGGASRVGYGELLLANNDGGLDGLLDRAFDGRRIVIRYGQAGAAYPANWTTVLTGTMAAPGWEWTRLALRIRDRLEELNIDLQPNRYAGDNALPAGLEGVDDLKDQPKPLCYGTVFNIPAVLVNSSRLIYQVNDGTVNSISAVYDRGAALTVGAVYTSQSDMETNAPSAGSFRAWPAGGYFRLGSTPAGLISADVSQGATSANRTTAQILKALALQAGIDAGDIHSGDVTALDTASNAEVGVWFNSAVTALVAMDTVAAAAGAWFGFDADGKLRMAQLQAPSGTPVATFYEWNLVNTLELQTTADGANAVPVYRVEVQYATNYSPQDTDLAGAVTAARRGWLAQAFRIEAASDPDVQTAHPLSEPLMVPTPLISQAAAASEAARRLALFGVRRDRVKAIGRLDTATLAALELGAVVQVTHPRYGYASGRLFLILGLQLDLRLNRAELLLWG